MIVGIINYGMGNLASVSRAVQAVGYTPYIAEHPAELHKAARIILPGVGAFAEGMDRLASGGWTDEIRRLVGGSERPLLGICLGMQFLADVGDEGGERRGLGLVPGRIRHLTSVAKAVRVPHVGWNELQVLRGDALLAHIPDRTDFYFVHSYAFEVEDDATLLSSVNYGGAIAAVVGKGNVWGTQFHPEKSSKAGLQLLRNFLERS